MAEGSRPDYSSSETARGRGQANPFPVYPLATGADPLTVLPKGSRQARIACTISTTGQYRYFLWTGLVWIELTSGGGGPMVAHGLMENPWHDDVLNQAPGKGKIIVATSSQWETIQPTFAADEGKVLVARAAQAKGWALEAAAGPLPLVTHVIDPTYTGTDGDIVSAVGGNPVYIFKKFDTAGDHAESNSIFPPHFFFVGDLTHNLASGTVYTLPAFGGGSSFYSGPTPAYLHTQTLGGPARLNFEIKTTQSAASYVIRNLSIQIISSTSTVSDRRYDIRRCVIDIWRSVFETSYFEDVRFITGYQFDDAGGAGGTRYMTNSDFSHFLRCDIGNCAEFDSTIPAGTLPPELNDMSFISCTLGRLVNVECASHTYINCTWGSASVGFYADYGVSAFRNMWFIRCGISWNASDPVTSETSGNKTWKGWITLESVDDDDKLFMYECYLSRWVGTGPLLWTDSTDTAEMGVYTQGNYMQDDHGTPVIKANFDGDSSVGPDFPSNHWHIEVNSGSAEFDYYNRGTITGSADLVRHHQVLHTAGAPAIDAPLDTLAIDDTNHTLYIKSGAGGTAGDWTLIGGLGVAGHPQGHDHTTADGSGVLTNDEHDGYSEYTEIAAPATPAANKLRLYAKDKAGVSALYFKKDDGTEVEVGAGGGGGGTLDASYDFGGAHLGRIVESDVGFPVKLRTGDMGYTDGNDDLLVLESNNSLRGTVIKLLSHASGPGSEIAFGTELVYDAARIRYSPASPEGFLFDVDSSEEVLAATHDTLIIEKGLNIGYPRGGSGGNIDKTLTASQNDWDANADQHTVIRINPNTANIDITGFVPDPEFPQWRIFIFHNVGAFNATLKDNSGSSAAANRFDLSGDYLLRPGDTCIVQYDDVTDMWRVIGGSGQSLSADHGLLLGNADDDHTQYVLLAGRAGGQTIRGGTLTGQNLDIRANAADTTSGVINVLDHIRMGTNKYIDIPVQTAPSGSSGYTRIFAQDVGGVPLPFHSDTLAGLFPLVGGPPSLALVRGLWGLYTPVAGGGRTASGILEGHITEELGTITGYQYAGTNGYYTRHTSAASAGSLVGVRLGAAGAGPVPAENNPFVYIKWWPVNLTRMFIGVTDGTISEMCSGDNPSPTLNFLGLFYSPFRKTGLGTAALETNPATASGSLPPATQNYTTNMTVEDDGDGVGSGDTDIGVNNHNQTAGSGTAPAVGQCIIFGTEVMKITAKIYEAFGTPVTIADGGDGITNSQTTIGVSSAAQIAAGHVVRVDTENILVGGVSGSDLTGCTRNYAGSSGGAVSHSEGAAVQRSAITVIRGVAGTSAAAIAEGSTLQHWGEGVAYTISSGDPFTASSPTNLMQIGAQFQAERVTITAVDTTNNVLTMTRGQDGTFARQYTSGQSLRLPPRISNVGGITAGATTLTYQDGVGDPFSTTGANSKILIGTERMTITAIDLGTRTLTVTRGTEGTTAASHAQDDVIYVAQSGWYQIRGDGSSEVSYAVLGVDFSPATPLMLTHFRISGPPLFAAQVAPIVLFDVGGTKLGQLSNLAATYSTTRRMSIMCAGAAAQATAINHDVFYIKAATNL